MGLKQGCILSPMLLHSINDITSVLERGCSFGGHRIKFYCMLMSFVMMAPTVTSLQTMINNLDRY